MFVNHENSKSRPTGTYQSVIAQIAEDGVCPFCPEYLAKYHRNPIIEKRYWLLTDNMYPYKPSKVHRLIIHKKHVAHINELPTEAWVELLEILREETARGKVPGGTLMIRFGDTKYTGASVVHLHANLVQSDPDDQSYDKTKGLTTRIG